MNRSRTRSMPSVLAITTLLLSLFASGCGRTLVRDDGRPTWSPWVGVDRRAVVQVYERPDIVRGTARVLVLKDGDNELTDDEMLIGLGEYRDRSGWDRGPEPRRVLHVVALFPTVLILDAQETNDYQWLAYTTEWRMSHDLYVIRLDSTELPKKLKFEDGKRGRETHVDLPWGRLIVNPTLGEVYTASGL